MKYFLKSLIYYIFLQIKNKEPKYNESAPTKPTC